MSQHLLDHVDFCTIISFNREINQDNAHTLVTPYSSTMGVEAFSQTTDIGTF